MSHKFVQPINITYVFEYLSLKKIFLLYLSNLNYQTFFKANYVSKLSFGKEQVETLSTDKFKSIDYISKYWM